MDNNFDNFIKTVPISEPTNIGGYNRYKLVRETKLPIVSFNATTDATYTTVEIGYFDQSGEYRRHGVKITSPSATEAQEKSAIDHMVHAIGRDERNARFANVPTIPPVYDLRPIARQVDPDSFEGVSKRICKAMGIKRVDFSYAANKLPNGDIEIKYSKDGKSYTMILPATGEGA